VAALGVLAPTSADARGGLKAVKRPNLRNRYDALVELLDQEEAEPTRKAVKPRDTGNNAHFTVI
jgi:hypothetical protein